MDDEKHITLEYLEKLSDRIYETIVKENLYRFSDRRIYLNDLLDSIDKIETAINSEAL